MTILERDMTLAVFFVLLPFVFLFCYAMYKIVIIAKKALDKMLRRQKNSSAQKTAPVPTKNISEKTAVTQADIDKKLQKRTPVQSIKTPGINLITNISNATVPLVTKTRIMIIGKLMLFSLFVAGYIFAGLIVKKYFFERPYVSRTVPQQNGVYVDGNLPIVMEFDKPINAEIIKANIVPDELAADVTKIGVFQTTENFLSQLTGKEVRFPIYAGIKIQPRRSIPYEKKIVIYLTDIENISGKDGKHEHAYEIVSPKIPQISDLSIKDKQEDVMPTEPLTISFDVPVADGIAVSAEILPVVNYEIVRSSENNVAIKFKEPLKQGTEYKAKLFINQQLVDLATKEIISKEDPEVLSELSFKTVLPPGLKQVTPQGSAVIPSEKVVMTFTEPMIKSSVEGHFSFEPATAGTVTWNDEGTVLTFSQNEPFPKATGFTLKIDKGIRTQKGGISTEEIVHKFETVGPVKVVSFSPGDGSKSVAVGTNITIEFDQDVDKSSAQNQTKISPGIAYDTVWEGNKMIIDPKGNVSFGTKYSVTVHSGVKSVHGMDSKDSFGFAFTTQPETVTIGVPRYTQPAGSFVCNVVATRMALAYRGIYVSTEQVIGSIGAGTPHYGNSGGNPNVNWIDHYGVHWDPIANYIRNYRGADVRRGWSTAGIANEIKNGNPVIIWWYNGVSSTNVDMSWYNQFGAKPGLHSVTVYGFKGSEYAPTHLLVKDPWFSKELYTNAEFNSKWSYFGKTAVVVK